uniref:Uncharacterized protein n=1 Tax=viral metagenome TaxID=1070528 RepID=A0A6C0KY45_9ZZZZ
MGGVTGVHVMHIEEATELICQLLSSESGIAIGKIGTSEFNAINFYRHRLAGSYESYPDKIKKDITVNAGLWAGANESLDEAIDAWAKSMIESIGTFDAVVAWNPMYPQPEDMFFRVFARGIPRIVLRALEPYYSPTKQYTLQMTKGPIAVVSPFAESIRRQWQNRTKIFPPDGLGGQMWLEEQTLVAIQAPFGPAMTPNKLELSWSPEIRIAGHQAGIQNLVEQVKASGARYAFVGMGALSILLVAALKKEGIKAIHTGGGTQIMFGVLGERWKYHNVISKLFNEHWIRPSEKETPSSAASVEGACYW